MRVGNTVVFLYHAYRHDELCLLLVLFCSSRFLGELAVLIMHYENALAVSGKTGWFCIREVGRMIV